MALYAFDGTWNVRDQKGRIESTQSARYGDDAAARRDTAETNVHRFAEFYGAARTEYLQGVGTRFGRVGSALGGFSGAGGRWRVRRMYDALCRRYFAGDHDIDIVGFSRGAALAVHFANVIATHGVRNPQNPRHLGWRRYPGLGWTFRPPKPAPGDLCPKIRFLGLFDTVASVGVPIGPLRNRGKWWSVTTLPGNVARSFHAMAMDEVRSTFTLVRPRPARAKQHYEVWFRGVHSNIGGGYLDRGLSDITLAWMLEMYLWTLGKEGGTPPERILDALARLRPDPGPPPSWTGDSFETLEPNADGELGRPVASRRQSWRELPAAALVHHSVYRRTKNLLLDHYSSNRRLLRQIPGDARPVYDPPFFYSDTPRSGAERIAKEAFAHVPVRASSWLTLHGEAVFRSDTWIAVGEDRDAWRVHCTQKTFVAIATEWLLSGKPESPPEGLPATFADKDGVAVKSLTVATWVIQVLAALEPYVPALRDHRVPARPASAPSPGEAPGPAAVS